jgi:hypothetical protein
MFSLPRALALAAAATLSLLAAGGEAMAQRPTRAPSGGLFGEAAYREPTTVARGRGDTMHADYESPDDGAPTSHRAVRAARFTSSRRATSGRPPQGGEVVWEGPAEFEAESFGGPAGGHGEYEAYAPGEIWDTPRWNFLDNLWLFAGATGFKGPIDQGINGNFGFHEGVNYTLPLLYDRPIAAQVGARFTQSDLSGSRLDADTRHQAFFTAGVFRRVDYGWQLGAAFDWLKDDFYAEIDVHQVRAEISFVSSCGNELGFMAAVSTADDSLTTGSGATAVTQFFEVNDQFAMFFRVPMACGGDGRIFAGGTSDRDGLLGADFTVPINERWSLQAAATYLIPEESSTASGTEAGYSAEQWGVGFSLVWYPGRSACEGYQPLRPLFNVADNMSLLVDRRLP